MNKKILHYIKDILAAVMLCSVFLSYNSYADDIGSGSTIETEQEEIILEKTEDEGKTIGELKENIEELKETQDTIASALDELKADAELGNFFKTDLQESEITSVIDLIQDYRIENTTINKELLATAEEFESTTIIKQELLELRKQLYIDLVPYIKIEKLDEYKEYIKGDAGFLIETKELSEDIIRKEEVINEKVEQIEEKIEENKKNIEIQLYEIIATKIDEYFIKIIQNEKFLTLPYDAKINIVDKLLERLHEKIEDLKASPAATTTMIQKIDILEEVFIEKLEILKSELK